MGFPRQESWNGLPFPPPGDLLAPGIKPVSPALADRFLYHGATWEPPHQIVCSNYFIQIQSCLFLDTNQWQSNFSDGKSILQNRLNLHFCYSILCFYQSSLKPDSGGRQSLAISVQLFFHYTHFKVDTSVSNLMDFAFNLLEMKSVDWKLSLFLTVT